MIFKLLVVILALVFIVSGYKKGFTRSVLSFFSVLIAVILASLMSGCVSEVIYDSVVKPSIISTVKNTITDTSLATSMQKSQAVLNKMPTFFVNRLNENGVNQNELEHLMTNKIDETSLSVAELFKPVAFGFVKTIMFFVLFILIMFLLRLVLKCIKLSKVPVLGKVDSLFGAAFGLLKFIAFMVAFFYIANVFIPAVNDNSFFKEYKEATNNVVLSLH